MIIQKVLVDDIVITKNNEKLISGSRDKTIKIWSINDNYKLINTINVNKRVYSLCLFDNDKKLIVGTGDGDNKPGDLLIINLLENNNIEKTS